MLVKQRIIRKLFLYIDIPNALKLHSWIASCNDFSNPIFSYFHSKGVDLDNSSNKHLRVFHTSHH